MCTVERENYQTKKLQTGFFYDNKLLHNFRISDNSKRSFNQPCVLWKFEENCHHFCTKA